MNPNDPVRTPIHDLSPGAILMQPVTARGRTVFAVGKTLSRDDITQLKQLRIATVVVDPNGDDGPTDRSRVEADVLSPEFREQAVEQIKGVYNDFRQFNQTHVDIVHTLATQLMQEATRPSRLGIAVHDLRSHSEYTYRHCVNVTAIALAVGVRMGLSEDELNTLAMGGLLHDIGKMRLSAEILEKNGPLEPDELNLVQQHPIWGWDLLMEVGGFSPQVAAIARQHHEMVDGSGYPDGLKLKRIHILTRIVTVIDLWDALRSPRPYKAAWAPDQVLDLFASPEMADRLDQDVLSVFRPLIVPFPVGSRVMLSGGRIGVVVEVHPDDYERPVVYMEQSAADSRLDLREHPSLKIVKTLSLGE